MKTQLITPHFNPFSLSDFLLSVSFLKYFCFYPFIDSSILLNQTYYVVICNFFRLYSYSIHQWKKKILFPVFHVDENYSWKQQYYSNVWNLHILLIFDMWKPLKINVAAHSCKINFFMDQHPVNITFQLQLFRKRISYFHFLYINNI